MTFDKRIWKTGVLAAAITLVAALFIMRLDDWSKGLTSGFIAYGQSGTGSGGTQTGTGTSSSCGSGGTGTGTVCVTKTLPHLVGGGGYSSVIEVINTSNATEGVSASFFNQDGSESTATYSMSIDGAASTTFIGADDDGGQRSGQRDRGHFVCRMLLIVRSLTGKHRFDVDDDCR